MDQLRINRLKEKRKMLEQQINQHKQLELLELEKLKNQQRLNEFQQQHQQQTQPPKPTSSEMRGALQSRLGAVYAGTEALLEPTPMNAPENNPMMPSPPAQSPSIKQQASNGGSTNSGDVPSEDSAPMPTKDRRMGLVRENSLKMESIFENDSGSDGRRNRKKFDMSMSGTSLSLGFDEESELSALFDTSMKIERGLTPGYATSLNDRGARSPPRSPKTTKEQRLAVAKITGVGGTLLGNSTLLGMSLASLGADKSNSSMSCDSSLSRLFDDNGAPAK